MSAQPIRLLHFADLHIGMENYGRLDVKSGLNQRVRDFVERLKEIVDYAIAHEADLVIFAGDAFKTREPNPTWQRAFARQIKRLSDASIPTVLLVGNHDVPVIESRASSVDIFAVLDVPHVIVGRKEAYHCIQTRRGLVQVVTLPWFSRSNLRLQDMQRDMTPEEMDAAQERAVSQLLAALAQQLDPQVPAVLTAHLTVRGAVFGSERSVMLGRDATISLDTLQLSAWDYVALGHIHKHQCVSGNRYPAVVYAGSVERVDFGEEDEAKGFCWVELARGATRWQFVPLSARRFVSIHADATQDGDSPTEAVLRAIERHTVRDAVVRVHVRLRWEQLPTLQVRQIEQALSEAYHVAGIVKDVVRASRSRIGAANVESLTEEQLLERYLISRKTDPQRLRELMSLAKSLMRAEDEPLAA